MEFSKILEFTNFLLGCYSRAKELHWRTESKSIHESLGVVSYSVLNLVDSTIEQSLAIYGRNVLKSGDVQAAVLLCDDFEELLDFINTATSEFRNSLEGIDEFKPLISMLDDFLLHLNIDKFRSELV